jgi:uncharacterized protein (TIGR00295 family)
VIPSEEEALALHRKYGSNEILVRHCKTVASVTKILVDGFKRSHREIDTRAVVAGALLHDIGRNRAQSVRHAVEGAAMLVDEGVDEKVVQIVRRHIGAGISPAEAQKLGLPDYDYVPRTLEERTVCFADKMVGSDQVRPFDEEVERFVRKGHDVAKLLALKRGLEDDLKEDPERLVLDNFKESK